jgi:hypothetical protein
VPQSEKIVDASKSFFDAGLNFAFGWGNAMSSKQDARKRLKRVIKKGDARRIQRAAKQYRRAKRDKT